MTGSGKEGESPSDFNEYVSKDGFQRLVDGQRTYIDRRFDELMCNINGLVTQIEHVEQRPPPRQHRRHPHDGDEEEDEDADLNDDARDADHLRRNRQGMGRNQNRGNNDPFAKTKFTIISFAGTVDPEVYLDWELDVE
jgi:hypothetical protein